MKKSVLLLFSALILVLAIVGCDEGDGISSQGESVLVVSSSADSESEKFSQDVGGESLKEESGSVKSPQRVERVLPSGVVVNAQVTASKMPDSQEMVIYKGEMQRLSVNEIKEALLGDEETTLEEHESKESLLPGSMYRSYRTAKGENLIETGDSVLFYSPGADNTDFYFMPFKGSEQYNGDRFLTGENLNFASREKALSETVKILETLDIEVADEPLIYTLSHKTLNEEKKRLQSLEVQNNREVGVKNEDGSEMTEAEILKNHPQGDYTKDDDAYYMKLFASVDGFRLTEEANGIFGNGGNVAGSSIEAIYTKDGLARLSAYCIYKQGDEISRSKGLSMDDAIDKMDEKFGEIITESDYEIKDITFEYMAIATGVENEFELTPIWNFGVNRTSMLKGKKDETKLTAFTAYETVIINAVTGEEIIKDNSI